MKFNDLLKTNAADNDLIFNDKHRAIKNYRLMQWAKWATFGLYIVAVFMLYVADVWGISSFIAQKSNDWVALIVFSAIAFALAYFLASSKEAVYEDIAIHRAEGYKLKVTQIIALGLFLSSALLFEAFATSNNQQHIANAAAEQSDMFKSVTNSNVNLSNGSAALTAQLQAAQMRLADCKVKMEKAIAAGRKYDCAQSEANLAAVRESMNMANQLAEKTNADALTAKTDAMIKVREHFDKPMFQAIGKATGTDNNTGMMIVIGILIFIFECQHIMALFAYGNALRRIKTAVPDRAHTVAPDRAHTVSPVPNYGTPNYNTAAPLSGFANSARQTVGEYAAKVEAGLKSSPEVIANEYARAQAGRNQALEAMGNAAKSLGDKIEMHWSDNAPTITPSKGFKQTEAQAANVAKIYNDETEKHAAGKVFNDESPAPITRMTNGETILALVDAAKKSGAKTEADIQAAVFDAYAKLPAPADLSDKDLTTISNKIAEKYRAHTVTETVTDRAHTVDTQSVRDRAHTVAATMASSSIYGDWLSAIAAGDCKKTVRDTRTWVQKRFAGNQSGKTSMTPTEYANITTMLFTRAVKDPESGIRLNPDYTNGGKKYL